MRLALHRLFLAVLVCMFAGVALFNEVSLSYQLVRLGGPPAMGAFCVLGALALMAIGDAVVNDLLPARYQWRCALRWRRFIWLWIAVTLAGLAFAVTGFDVDTWLVGFYTLMAAWCVAVAFVDLYVVHAAVMGGRRATDRMPLDDAPVQHG